RRAPKLLVVGWGGGWLRSIVRPRHRPRGSRFFSRRDRRIQIGFSLLAPIFLEGHGIAKIVQQGHNVGHKCRPHVPAKYLVRLKYQNDVRNQR
ncbi:unnamed protein product, partial [Musa acuminata subsp. burmannicoides]